jgi:DNA-binding CsgD family transcriptional regulator
MRNMRGPLHWGISLAGVLPAVASAALLYPLLSTAGINGATPAYVPVFGMITALLLVAFSIIIFYLYVHLCAAYQADACQLPEEAAGEAETILPTKGIGLSQGFIREFSITKREEEVIGLILEGKTNKEIAIALGFSVDTAKMHAKNIYRKTGVSGRFALSRACDPVWGAGEPVVQGVEPEIHSLSAGSLVESDCLPPKGNAKSQKLTPRSNPLLFSRDKVYPLRHFGGN